MTSKQGVMPPLEAARSSLSDEIQWMSAMPDHTCIHITVAPRRYNSSRPTLGTLRALIAQEERG